MKKYILLLLVLSQVYFGVCQSRYDKEPYLTKSLSNESIKNVEATASGGSISVTGVNPSESRVELYVSPQNSNTSLSKEELKQRLEELYDINISVTNNTLTATTKLKRKMDSWKKGLNITFKIFVPENVSTNLSTSGGNISLANLSGDQQFTTSGGNLHIDNVNGKSRGKTSGGNISLENSKNDIELRTSGGNIHANNCTGNLKLSTSGGSLDLKQLNGNINASTTGGNISGNDIAGELITHTSGGNIHLTALACSLETSTSGGNINVSINQLANYIKINNSGGNIGLALPKNKGLNLDLSGKIAGTHFENFDGTINENNIKGKLNGGGIPITADAGHGRINIELR